MISLAVMLAVGQGVAPDPAEARLWYARTAESGSAHALRALGMMILVGEGGASDHERHVWRGEYRNVKTDFSRPKTEVVVAVWEDARSRRKAQKPHSRERARERAHDRSDARTLCESWRVIEG